MNTCVCMCVCVCVCCTLASHFAPLITTNTPIDSDTPLYAPTTSSFACSFTPFFVGFLLILFFLFFKIVLGTNRAV